MFTLLRGRRRPSMTFLVLTGLGAALILGVSACGPAASSAPTSPAAQPATLQPASSSPVAVASPVSAALPAPTPGGVPPTVVGSPAAAAPSPVVASASTVAVRITITPDRQFDPPQVTVKLGDTVQWINAGRAPQTVTADPARVQNASDVILPSGVQPWDSGVLNSSQTFTRTFDTPGTYRYVSLPGEGQGMAGQITVQG